ncbi:hypothetical protein [Paenibacillus sp. Soil522]|uniref:hypothetical protein n=1 Tax=Paenibacillus sp. Soil522 TaxID=1736388 RepID=UPI0006F8B545|nr:hypothetical protein [Paenibacillus sp. Soil522]KRE25866.1 hypothetical protein ASG81_26865 [Paenibacillus sp. Soil522]
MGILRNIIEPYMRYRSLIIGLKRNDYQKLQMIADDLNEHVQGEYEFTPELIASRVMKTFIDEAYSDSTKRIVKAPP